MARALGAEFDTSRAVVRSRDPQPAIIDLFHALADIEKRGEFETKDEYWTRVTGVEAGLGGLRRSPTLSPELNYDVDQGALGVGLDWRLLDADQWIGVVFTSKPSPFGSRYGSSCYGIAVHTASVFWDSTAGIFGGLVVHMNRDRARAIKSANPSCLLIYRLAPEPVQLSGVSVTLEENDLRRAGDGVIASDYVRFLKAEVVALWLYDPISGRVLLKQSYSRPDMADQDSAYYDQDELRYQGPWDEPPKAIRTMQPEYPPAAAGDSGSVTVTFYVEPDGSVTRLRASGSLNPDLRDAALAAARAWKFLPGRNGGVSVPAMAETTFYFKASGVPLPDR